MASTCVGHQLVLTVGLLAVVVYLYTVVAFNFFRKFYNKSEDEDEPDMKCDDMMTVSVACLRSKHRQIPLFSQSGGPHSPPPPLFVCSVTSSTCTWG